MIPSKQRAVLTEEGDGLDFAYGPDAGPPGVTDPVTFNYTAADFARTAELVIFVGDAESGRPDRIDISDNSSEVNQLDGDDGASWDQSTLYPERLNTMKRAGMSNGQLLWRKFQLRDTALGILQDLARLSNAPWL